MSFINNNNNITLNLLEAARRLKLKSVIQICSTSEVYGQVKKNEVPIRENNPMRPASPYAVSKASLQDLCSQNYQKNYGLNIIITRMFTYLNPRRLNLFASHWANQIVKIEGEQKILYHGNLNSTRTIIDIEDAMKSYWVAATRGRIGEIYNIGGNKIFKISKFLDILKKFIY